MNANDPNSFILLLFGTIIAWGIFPAFAPALGFSAHTPSSHSPPCGFCDGLSRIFSSPWSRALARGLESGRVECSGRFEAGGETARSVERPGTKREYSVVSTKSTTGSDCRFKQAPIKVRKANKEIKP
jgi:hypothetical protein